MFKEEEEKLNQYKKTIDRVPVSLEALDEAILKGFNQAKQENKRKRKYIRSFASLVAAAVLLIGFFTSIRLSPAFAGYLTTIPGMDRIVELVQYNKGIMSAIENDHYQKLGVFEEKDGFKVIVDGVIADKTGIVIFYTFESDKKLKEVYIKDTNLESLDVEKVFISSTAYSSSHFSNSGESTYSGSLEYFFDQPLKAKELAFHITVDGEINNSFTIPFTLKGKLPDTKTYELNKTAIIDGQKITFTKATVDPLRVAVHVKKDPNNTKKLLNFDDLRLIDENGEMWNTAINGAAARKISDDEDIIYLQSNYFRQPKQLYLALNKIQAIDKNETEIVVDIKNEKILKQPKGGFLKGVNVEGDTVEITMPLREDFSYFFFGNVLDKNGVILKAESTMLRDIGGEGVKSLGVRIPNLNNIEGPLTLEVSYYPSWIEGDIKIKIE